MRRHDLHRWPLHDRKQLHVLEADSAFRSLKASPVGVCVERSGVRLVDRVRAVTRKRASTKSLRIVQTRFRQPRPQRRGEIREYRRRSSILQRLWSARIAQGQNGVDGVSTLSAVEERWARPTVRRHSWIRRRRAAARIFFFGQYFLQKKKRTPPPSRRK